MNNKQDSYFSAMIKFKIISVVFSILIILAVVAFFTTGVSSEQVFKAYTSLNTTNGSNMNSLKKLNFLASYIKETGDLSILTKVGLASTEEEAREILAEIEDTINPTEEEEDDKQVLTGDLARQVEELKTNSAYNNSYYNKLLITRTLNGKLRVWESQSAGAWSVYKPNQSTMSAAGCFYYATTALLTNVTGDLWTIERLLTSLGGTVTLDNSKNFIVSGKPINSLDGGLVYLNKALDASGTGLKAVNASKIDWNNVGKNKAYIMYYLKADNGNNCKKFCSPTGAGKHWTCLIDYDGSYGYQLGNEGRDKIPKSDYENSKFKFIYEVSY